MLQHFEFHPSRYLIGLLIIAHGAALAVLEPIALPLWAKLATAALLLFSLLYYLRRNAWLNLPTSCVGLVLEGDHAVLMWRDGSRLPCAILHDSFVTPYITVLNVSPQGSHFVRSILILPDSLEAESFRQLRVRLKWSNQSAS